MRDLLEKVLGQTPLTAAETLAVFAAILDGAASDAQIAALLSAWRVKGETDGELIAGARAMRERAAKVTLPPSTRPVVDNCGTGGDGAGSFNISTAAAIVAAAAGARVAKHGNRSVSSRCGSADLLFAAGFPDALSPDATARLLADTGFTFFFAPSFHPAMKAVAPVRKALGVRTIFNLLGPLANPIAPERQLVGVGDPKYLEPVARALAALGVERALVVHSRDGMDELSPAAVTDAAAVEGTKVSRETFDPKDFGVKGTAADLAGGGPEDNKKILETLLASKGSQGLIGAVALNAGAVLWLAGVSPSIAEGVETAREVLATGKARDFFQRWLVSAAALKS
jgi:anthranilate phosphoribosyltransferase